MRTIGSSGTYTDVVTAASSNAAQYFSVLVPQPTLAAKNTSVITPLASSFTIQGPPITGTNQTITNPYAFNVQNGASRLSGPLVLSQTNTSNTVSLVTSASTSTNYTLTLPSSVPATTGQALLSDTSGNLSWGSAGGAATQSTFSGANNATTPTPVSGLTVTASPTVIPIYVAVNATTSYFAIITITVYSNTAGSTWVLDSNTVGDNTGVRFDVTSAGQIVYYSGNYSGFTSLTFTWFMPYVPIASATSSLNLASALSVGTSTTLANNAISGTPSSTNGNLLFISGTNFTDTNTAASGTAAAFNGTYIGAPILRATNTSVTTTNASSLTIAGAPTAGTNETISNAYALYVQSGLAYFAGASLFTNLPVTATQQQYIARFYLTSTFSPPSGTWSYFPSQFAVANDLPPSIRASVSSTNTGATINYNTTTGLIFLPVTGRYAFNIWAFTSGGQTTNYEFRLCTYSAPAWPAAGSTLKSYGTGQTASTLASTTSSVLSTSSYAMYSENSLSYIGEFPATTLIAPLVNNAPQLNFGQMFIEVRLLNALT